MQSPFGQDSSKVRVGIAVGGVVGAGVAVGVGVRVADDDGVGVGVPENKVSEKRQASDEEIRRMSGKRSL